MRYTEKVHAAGLIKMLEQTKHKVCENGCPAKRTTNNNSDWLTEVELDDRIDKMNCCDLCYSFIGIDLARRPQDSCICPCFVLGQKEAIKKTWIALETRGDI